jgi:hypothetical protein
MKDFSIIAARVLLKIHSVAPIRGFNPPSVVVLGDKLNLTQEVFYNNIKVTEFVISAPNRLVVRIPTSQVGKEFVGIQVFSSVNVTKTSSALSFELIKPLRQVEGIERLVQSWMIVFFTSPGSDVFDLKSGGGVRSIIGKNTNTKGKGVSADLALAIERTQSELLRLQAQNSKIPLSEKLLSATLNAMNYDDRTTTLSATVGLKNMLGEQAEVSVR